MRLLKVIGFFWISFYVTVQVALQTFPINFNDYPFLLTNGYSIVIMSGLIYGFGMLHFYAGFAVMYERLLLIYVR
jgi:hypothetical protein